MIFRLGELFCGPGGIAWGATNAHIDNDDFGIIHQWANDYDADTCETYRVNICPDAPNTVYHEDKVPSTAPYVDIDNTCRNAIENPPIPENAYNNELTRQSETVVRRLQHILPGQNAFTADLPEDLRLNITGAKISQIYKRLDPTKPSYTVTGSGGGGTHIYHWEEPRALTNRERAKVH